VVKAVNVHDFVSIHSLNELKAALQEHCNNPNRVEVNGLTVGSHRGCGGGLNQLELMKPEAEVRKLFEHTLSRSQHNVYCLIHV